MEWGHRVQSQDDGKRAADVLALRAGLSKTMIKKIRLYGVLLLNGKPHRMIDPVCDGDWLVARYEPNGSAPLTICEVPGVQIRFEDDWVLVANKPAGLVTHPTRSHQADALTSLLSDKPLHPVNRLDRDTSGLVLIAKNSHAHYVISQKPRTKRYLALLHGRLPAPVGLIQAPIRRCENSIIKREMHEQGADARTLWRECRYYPSFDVSLVELTLLTGRTHQLRVHCQACGCPIVGDQLYGHPVPDELDRQIGRQALHAARLDFCHPMDGQNIRVTAPLPRDFRLLLGRIRSL